MASCNRIIYAESAQIVRIIFLLILVLCYLFTSLGTLVCHDAHEWPPLAPDSEAATR